MGGKNTITDYLYEEVTTLRWETLIYSNTVKTAPGFGEICKLLWFLSDKRFCYCLIKKYMVIFSVSGLWHTFILTVHINELWHVFYLNV